jgi:hypothetical protein
MKKGKKRRFARKNEVRFYKQAIANEHKVLFDFCLATRDHPFYYDLFSFF